MVDAGDGNVEGVVFGIIGDAQDVFGEFGTAYAFENNALVGVKHVGLSPLEEGGRVVYFAAGYDIAAQIAGRHAVAFDADKEGAIFERGNEIPFYLVRVDACRSFEETRHRRQRNERNALARWGGDKLRVPVAFFFFGRRVVRG